jgi:hypothetical protein
LIDWLNAKGRPGNDPVEKLLEWNARMQSEVPWPVDETKAYLARLVRRTKFAVAPVLVGLRPNRWQVDWRLVGRMAAAEGLALIKLLQLAEQGLLGRVRKCAKKECGRWFFARFQHQRFDKAKCQQETFRSDPEWKQKRAEHMRRLRHDKKLQEQGWLKPRKGAK